MNIFGNNKYNELSKKGIPAFLIPGIIFASIYGTTYIEKIKSYYGDEEIFPRMVMVDKITDGDTFSLTSGQGVRMLGINTPDRGKTGETEAKETLKELIENKKVWLEYDRYQDDKYGRILAWVWRDCESNEVKFAPDDYMHLNGNESRDYLTTNPEGCKKGALVNKEMVALGRATAVVYEKRGKLKYDLKIIQ